jgi:glycosyltransferase involved in cell wall biosynthesis
MAPIRFMLVSTHTEQITGYSKVSHNLLKQLSTLHPLVKVFHFGFQRAPVNTPKPARPLTNVIQYDAAANENPKQAGFGFNCFKDYLETVNPDIVMIYNDPIVVNNFLTAIKDVEKTFKLWVYLDQVYKGTDMGLLRNIENTVDRVICFTDSWRDHLKSRLTTSNIKFDVLEHGVDPLVFKRLADTERSMARKSLKIPGDARVFLNMNRNSQRKRLDLTVMGFARLLKKYPDAPLYLIFVTSIRPDAGSFYHPVTIFIEELKRFDLDTFKYANRLICVDTTPPNAYFADDAINQIYNAADIGVNTSNGEGFGLCQLEHMATGAPQVVLDIGGYRSFMNEEVGVLLPPSNYSYLPMTAGVGLYEESVTADEVLDGMDRALKLVEDPQTAEKCVKVAEQRPWSRICDEFLESILATKESSS